MSQQSNRTEIIEPIDSQPGVLPALGVWHRIDWDIDLVSATFAEPAGFTCDIWCYELHGIAFECARPLENGKIELRHRWEGHAEAIVTLITPEPGAIELAAYLENPDGSRTSGDGMAYPDLNTCWQLINAPMFASQPDPYPDFVKRCFILTDDGLTLLHHTARFPIPVRSAEDPYNNPPWVQMYLPVWQPLRQAPPDSWAAYSTDRYIYPVIGAISRDGRYLTALGCESNDSMCQAWHDCMHNNTHWQPAADGLGMIWRQRVYVLRNDPEELLRRLRRDFPRALTLKDRRVPA